MLCCFILVFHHVICVCLCVDSNDVDIYELDPECIPTPHGGRYWVPDVPVNEKPKEGDEFATFDEAYNAYKEYAAKARFCVRKGGTKNKNGQVTHKHLVCHKYGKPRKSVETNTLIDSPNQDVEDVENENVKRKRKRRSTTSVTDCKAHISLKRIVGTNSYVILKFVENHNHKLIDPANMDLSRARRQLEFGDHVFIHRASLSSIGPQKAHKLRVALLGGFDKVRGMPVDWNNFHRGMNSFIGERDAQMLVDKMLKRKEHVPGFSFHHHTKKKELCRMFWADETMKCNYVAFGDVVSFDATYYTNK